MARWKCAWSRATCGGRPTMPATCWSARRRTSKPVSHDDFPMKKNLMFLARFLLITLAGCCFFGDPVGASRTVSVKLPVPEGRGSLSADDLQVEEALKIIDDVLTSNGFVRDPISPAPDEQGRIVTYGYFCGVAFKNNRL